MNFFWEIEENIATEKTDVEFHNFDHPNGFLSFWNVVRYWKIFFNVITAVLMGKLKLLSTNMEAKHYSRYNRQSVVTYSKVYIMVP